MKLLLVCGPWCSGTTAVAGLIDRLGAVGFGAYFQINDPMRPNSYEFIPFKDTLRAFISPITLSLAPNSEQDLEADLELLRSRILNQEFGAYDVAAPRPIFLKHPLSAFAIPQICSVFETKLVYVLRPLDEIDATCRRRGWPPRFGRPSAEVVYASMFRTLIDSAYPTMIVRFPELLKRPKAVASRIAEFSELGASSIDIERAAGFVDTPSTD